MRNEKKSDGKIELSGHLAPEVSIEEICLCGDDDYCIKRNEIPVIINVLVHLDLNEVGNVMRQIQKITEMGWRESEGKKWRLVLKEV